VAGAAEALANDDPRAALIALLDVWRRYPDAVLAHAIERVGARAVRGAEIPSGLAELDAYKANDPVLRHHLLSTTSEPLRLEQLATEPDPRVAARVVEVIRRPTRKVHGGSAAAWKRIFALLVTAGDPRVVDALATLREAWVAHPDLDGRDHQTLERRLEEVRRDVIATFAAPATLPATERAALATLALDDGADGSALLAAVYAAPEDDAPRAVYADFLLERGGIEALHGELIALQLLPARTLEQAARVNDLVASHGKHFLGSLAPRVRPGSELFDRGFLVACQVAANRYGHFVEPAPDPAWATVREIIGWVPASPMPALRSVTRLDDEALVALAALASKPTLDVLGYDGELRHDGHAAALRSIPAARLELTANRWLREPPPDVALELRTELAVTAAAAQLAGWFARIQRTQLRRFELVLSHRVWIVTTPRIILCRPDVHWTLELAECGGGRTNLGELANALAALPARRFAAVTIRPHVVAEQPALGEQERRLLTR
jgi:uncharacterized protein (TIGR02996 family)